MASGDQAAAACCCAAIANVPAKPASPNTTLSCSTMADGSLGGTNSPVRPWVKYFPGHRQQLVATIGNPAAIASSTTLGDPSEWDGSAKIVAI